jgi:hypothetical protein
MIVFSTYSTYKDGRKVRPCLFLSSTVPNDIANNLQEIGYQICQLSPFSLLPKPVNSHPDMLLFPLPNKKLLTFKSYFCSSLPQGNWLLHSIEDPEKKYPRDIGLNFFIVGNSILGKCSYRVSELKNLPYRPIDVKQGYARCSICQVSPSAAITADVGIARALIALGVDVLLISSGNILLPGYDTGFIGGASFSDSDSVYFFGRLSEHPDGKRMSQFIAKQGKKSVSLSSCPLTDYGGAIIWQS